MMDAKMVSASTMTVPPPENLLISGTFLKSYNPPHPPKKNETQTFSIRQYIFRTNGAVLLKF